MWQTVLLFQAGWLVLVLGHENLLYLGAIALILLYLVVDLYKTKPISYLAYFSPKLLMFSIGCITDWSLAKLQIIEFASNGSALPFWLLLLWLLFSITFETCYSWINGKLWVAVILGGIFGPASYWAASKLSSVVIQMPIEFTMFSTVFWAVLFVTFLRKPRLEI